MLRLVVQRLGVGLLTLLLVSLLLFSGTEIVPGDTVDILLGMEATPQTLAALRKELGLDRLYPGQSTFAFRQVDSRVAVCGVTTC